MGLSRRRKRPLLVPLTLSSHYPVVCHCLTTSFTFSETSLHQSSSFPLGAIPTNLPFAGDARGRGWREFSLQDLRQIKTDLRRFSDDPDKYIDVFQSLTHIFDMTWKDLMSLLNKALTRNEVKTALEAAEKFADDLFLSYKDSHRGMAKGEVYPTGCQAVPRDDPEWDPDDPLVTWKHKHFQMCLLEGLRRSRVKPLNYAKLSLIIQGREETSPPFQNS